VVGSDEALLLQAIRSFTDGNVNRSLGPLPPRLPSLSPQPRRGPPAGPRSIPTFSYHSFSIALCTHLSGASWGVGPVGRSENTASYGHWQGRVVARVGSRIERAGPRVGSRIGSPAHACQGAGYDPANSS
jgi:hypothetical protein